MVRRWSYINSINCASLLSFRVASKASVDKNLNTLMYLKRRYKPATRLTRRSWARRKRNNNWIVMTNVLSNWATAYRFYKNHNRLLYYQFFTKRSFIAFDFVRASNSIPALNSGSEDVITSTYTKRILNYFKIYSNPRLKFFLSFRGGRPLHVSCYPGYGGSLFDVDHYFEPNNAVVPTLTDNVNSLTPLYDDPDNPSPNPNPDLSVFDLLTRHFYAILISLYKTLVLLTITRTL